MVWRSGRSRCPQHGWMARRRDTSCKSGCQQRRLRRTTADASRAHQFPARLIRPSQFACVEAPAGGRSGAPGTCGTRRFSRGSARPVALWRVDRRQIIGELRGGVRTGRVMFLQERQQRGTGAALGKAARVAMARRATVRKQPRCRFALIEILGLCPGRGEKSADQRNHRAKHKPTPPQLSLRHELR